MLEAILKFGAKLTNPFFLFLREEYVNAPWTTYGRARVGDTSLLQSSVIHYSILTQNVVLIAEY